MGIALWRGPSPAKPWIYRVNTRQELYSNDRLIARLPSTYDSSVKRAYLPVTTMYILR